MTQQQPPSEPKQQPLWCNTCDFKGDRVGTSSWVCNNPKCTITNSFGTRPLDLCCGPDDIILARVGCASHSTNTGVQARIDAVVKELERLKDESYKHADETAFCSSVHAFRGAGFAYGRAIALLKEGVGK